MFHSYILLPGISDDVIFSESCIHNYKFLVPGYVSIHTWGEECIQASLQFQQDQPQLRLWVPKNVQSRTDQRKGGAVQQYPPKFLMNTLSVIPEGFGRQWCPRHQSNYNIQGKGGRN